MFLSNAVDKLQGTDFTVPKSHPLMLAHVHNKELLLGYTPVNLYEYNALLLEPEQIINISLISNTACFAVLTK